MQYLLGRQIACVFLALTMICVANAQDINMPDHEVKPYYFGITLSGNASRFQLNHHPKFLQSDSIGVVEPFNSGGFGMGLLGTLRIFEHLEARFNPQLIFTNRTLQYQVKYPLPGNESAQTKRVESIYLSFPAQLKFSSDRINNFRIYVLGGMKYEYDLASNSTARRAEDLMKLRKGAFGYETGVGMSFYFPSFIFSPEIKVSNSLGNVHSRDANLIYSNVVDRMQARMIVIAIHLEG